MSLLHDIGRYHLDSEPINKLTERRDVLAAIRELEKERGSEPMKDLRARLRTLRKIVEEAAAVAALPPTPEAIEAKAKADLLAAKAARALAKASGKPTNVVPTVAKVDAEGDEYEDEAVNGRSS